MILLVEDIENGRLFFKQWEEKFLLLLNTFLQAMRAKMYKVYRIIDFMSYTCHKSAQTSHFFRLNKLLLGLLKLTMLLIQFLVRLL
ncbi:hypothetical protein CCP4SC76_1710010 [Gammaproteobacteria bacterium]